MLIVPLTPQQLLAFRYEKTGRKSLSFTVRVYLNLQLSFFTQFLEKRFLYANTKGADQPAHLRSSTSYL